MAEVTAKRKRKYASAYSSVTQEKAEEILGIRFWELVSNAERASQIVPYKPQLGLKSLVYDRLVDLVESEGFPEAMIEPFKEAVVHDVVGDVMRVIVANYKRETGARIILTREKEVVSKSGETGGNMEFILMDTVSVAEEAYLVIIEAKRDAIGSGLGQCLMAMRDAHGGRTGRIFGFVTTGIDWQLMSYDGTGFRISDRMTLLFARLRSEKDLWIERYSELVDVIYALLNEQCKSAGRADMPHALMPS